MRSPTLELRLLGMLAVGLAGPLPPALLPSVPVAVRLLLPSPSRSCVRRNTGLL